jgi:hypothetical protein
MSTLGNLIENAQTPGGVAGTLALAIAGTLCVVYFRNPSGNPDIEKVLTFAFTSIIGFYFGTASAPKPPVTPPPANQNGAPAPHVPAVQ